MKAIIVDDENKSRKLVARLLKEYCEDVNVVAEASNVTEAIEVIVKYAPDIVFLDIEMPGGGGFTLLEYFEGTIPFDVIFITAYNEFAVRAFEFSAIDYLLKPINIKRLEKAIEKIRSKNRLKAQSNLFQVLRDNLNKNSFETIALPLESGYAVIKTINIVYCKADRSYTTLYLKNGKTYVSSRGLSKIENLLQNFDFLRIHRSYLININEIVHYTRGKLPVIIMSNQDQLGVSLAKKEAFLQTMKRF